MDRAEMRIVFRSLYQTKLKMIEDECNATGNVFAGAGFGRNLDEIGGRTDAQRAQYKVSPSDVDVTQGNALTVANGIEIWSWRIICDE